MQELFFDDPAIPDHEKKRQKYELTKDELQEIVRHAVKTYAYDVESFLYKTAHKVYVQKLEFYECNFLDLQISHRP